ncbi:hypothetical protein F7725_005624 [Dissostichus mawsoni]|uniref:Uncharacterized protein n=1 Tax=Dissostichus mawsoni TaxID=36200 RepID=A0A7J5YU81_DISMA|nr:hypothetical protein F7725_005624 [Dissostichus mawsoni]
MGTQQAALYGVVEKPRQLTPPRNPAGTRLRLEGILHGAAKAVVVAVVEVVAGDLDPRVLSNTGWGQTPIRQHTVWEMEEANSDDEKRKGCSDAMAVSKSTGGPSSNTGGTINPKISPSQRSGLGLGLEKRVTVKGYHPLAGEPIHLSLPRLDQDGGTNHSHTARRQMALVVPVAGANLCLPMFLETEANHPGVLRTSHPVGTMA